MNTKNNFFPIVLVLAVLVNLFSLYAQDKAITQTKQSQEETTPADALQMLKDGNDRFTSGNMLARDLLGQAKTTAKGQYPYAVVLGCIDSRVTPEQVFDQGIGDIFDARIAGNFVNEDILGSMEFACKVTGAKLIMVLGHTNCGAIKGAIDEVKLGNLTHLLTSIKPAVDKTVFSGEKNSHNYDYVDLVSKENVLLAIENIKLKSPVLKQMLDDNEISIVGGMYDLQTGKVEFY
jgi:carbonic anhydrase